MKDSNIVLFLKESNAIENVYNEWALDNAVKAWDYIITEEKLTVKNILKTHDILMDGKLAKHLRGKFRTSNIVIGRRKIVGIQGDNLITKFEKTGSGVSHEKVSENIEDWIIQANNIREKTLLEVEDFIKKCHIDFEHIHPFIDGNGRVGRILLNWQRTKIGIPIHVIRVEEKHEYYRWFE